MKFNPFERSGSEKNVRLQAEISQSSVPFSKFAEGALESLETEKNILEKNSQEVLGLITEKDPATLTEKAKLLLTRIKNISNLKTDTSDSAAFLAFSAVTIIGSMPGVISPEYKDLFNGGLAIVAALSLVGVTNIKKYNEIIEKMHVRLRYS